MVAGCASSNSTTSTHTPVQVRTASQQDVQIQRNVLLAISGEPRIDSTRVAVTSNGGIVTLRGSVDTPLERQLAENVAGSVEGVVEIRNLLTFS